MQKDQKPAFDDAAIRTRETVLQELEALESSLGKQEAGAPGAKWTRGTP